MTKNVLILLYVVSSVCYSQTQGPEEGSQFDAQAYSKKTGSLAICIVGQTGEEKILLEKSKEVHAVFNSKIKNLSTTYNIDDNYAGLGLFLFYNFEKVYGFDGFYQVDPIVENSDKVIQHIDYCYKIIQNGKSQRVIDLQDKANGGDEQSMIDLAECYWDGRGTDKNKKLSSKWYDKAEKKVNIPQEHRVDLVYYWTAIDYYNEKRYDESFYYFQKASNLGVKRAKNLLANHYIQGRGTSKNEQKGFQLHLENARNGEADDQRAVGIYYYNGIGTTKDIEKSKYWLKKAVSKGNKDAIHYYKTLFGN